MRAVLFLATTLFPFCLTFYYGKTPMFFLPPSESTLAASSAAKAGSPVRRAPGGFEIPYDASHAWGMLNETYLGPLGWLLCLTAAPRGSVSAGMWSTICTRVALLVINQIKDVILALSGALQTRPPKPAQDFDAARSKNEKDGRADGGSSEAAPTAAATSTASARSDGARKRATAGGEKE